MLTCRLHRSACRCYVGSMAAVYDGFRDQFSLFPSIILQYRVSEILGDKKCILLIISYLYVTVVSFHD